MLRRWSRLRPKCNAELLCFPRVRRMVEEMVVAPRPPQVRGERLVAKVLDAALHELSVAGYRGLSVETVAERAEVNKTTIYRRWPTKAALVGEAMRTMIEDLLYAPDAGSLRADLIAFTTRIRDLVLSPRGRGLFRVMASEGDSPELAEVHAQIMKTTQCIPEEIIDRAVRRGEVPKGSDPELIVQCVVAPIINWCQMDNLNVDDRRIAEVVELVIVGAASGGGRKLRPVTPRRRR